MSVGSLTILFQMNFTSFFGAVALTALIAVLYAIGGLTPSPIGIMLTFALFGGPFMFLTKPSSHE